MSDHRNFYGRRAGKTLRPNQLRYLEEDLPRLQPGGITPTDNPDRQERDIFPGRPLWLEIGFGGGEHLHHQAALHPEVGIIGCEPFINGVAMLLHKLHGAPRDNVAIHPGDVRDLMDVLPVGRVDKAFLLYPDPWPKARHHRRRFVTREHIDPLARCLSSGAEFRIATDIPDYVRQTLEVVGQHPAFEWCAEGPDDWRLPWEDWVSTRYEQKALREGRTPHYLTFRRL